MKTDESLAIMEEKVRIPQATRDGFIECEVGGVFDGSYPNSTTRRGRVQGGGSISPTLTCNCDGLRRIEREVIIYDDYNSNVPKDQNVIGTLTTNIGSSAPRNGIKIIEPQILRKFRTEEQKERRRIMKDKGIKFSEASKAPATDGCSNTLTSVQKDNLLAEPDTASTKREYRIRKLTPRECFRLMGVSEGDIDKIQSAGISNAQQYKLAGNSIVVQVLERIFAQMLRFNEL